MLTESRFYGGSKAIGTVATKDYMHPDRAFAYNVVQAPLIPASRYLYTPDVVTNSWRWVPRQGRALFAVARSAGSNAATVKRDSDDATIATVANGEIAYFYLIDAATDEWHVEKRTLNTVRTFSTATSLADPANDDSRPTFDPFCYEGSLCEYLADLGNEPLDGEGGLDEVVAPMYQDPSEASNSKREAIRAADIVMPKMIAIRFERNCLQVDANHPWNGTYSLSQEFYDALWGAADAGSLGSSDVVHVLEYDSALSFPTTGAAETSHPYHLRRAGTTTPAWKHETDAAGVVNCHRYVWKVEVPYGPADDPTAFTLTIRFVMEHTLDNPAQADSDGGGVGTTNTHGAWGALFSVYVHTDELNSAWVENSTSFQPALFDNGYTWDVDNPFVCGIANGYTEDVEDKGVHPQVVAAATIAMTWHSPLGQNWVPLEEYETVPGSGENGKNLEDSYVVRNGNPWTDFGSCTDAAPIRHATPDDTEGILYNIVFGWPSPSTFLGKAMTYTGGFPVSTVLEWLCWENGRGEGTTFLKPIKPGWSEDCGTLDVAGGNCAEIAVCTSDGDNARDGDEGVWPRYEPSPCDGHPDEPFETVGGSHGCQKTNNGTTQKGEMDAGEGTHCCIATVGTRATFSEWCIRTKDVYGDPSGGGAGCDLVESDCSTAGSYHTTFVMPLYDYDMAANSSLSARDMRWSHYASDPAHPERDYTYDSGATTTLTQDIGTWSFGASEITNTAAAGSNPVRALMHHHDTSSGSWGWWGCTLSGTFERTLSNGHGVGAMHEQATNSALGIGMHVKPFDVDSVTVEVATYDGATKTVLDTDQLDGVSTDGVFSMTWHGTDVTFTYTPTSGPSYSYTASWWHADLDSGALRGSLYSEDTASNNAGFSGVVWNDTVGDLEEAVYGRVQYQSISCACNGADHLEGFGECADTWPAGCGSGDNCNCTQYSESKVQTLTTTHNPSPWSDIDDYASRSGPCERVDHDCPLGGTYWTADNPTYAGGPSPARCNCQGRPQSTLAYGCDKCFSTQSEKVHISFPLPVSQECYQTNTTAGTEEDPDVECINDIPLMCRGIAHWDWATAL